MMNRVSGKLVRAMLRVGMLILVGSTITVFAETRQEHVHQMAHSVMPFDISKTVHVFRMTESGGVLKVVVTEPGAKDQIDLIRQHLQHEAERFQQGDYSDPKKLHGADMPGLKELQAGVSRIQVSYAALPDGAAITFKTSDLHLITAVHRWFGAQLSEHGADARAE
jgi:TusA-related sulfurtransferase